jgi:hypothetical protein
VEEILQKVIAGGYIQLVLGLSTFLSFIISLSPIGDKIRKRFHLPYWSVWLFRRNAYGFINPISNYCVDKILAHKIDRRLYVLHGDCKKLGIISHKPKSIGSPDQFVHLSKMEVINLDSLIRKRFDNLGDIETDDNISVILNFWKPHLIGVIDSKIIQVIQISILCRLGFQIPFNWKLDCLEWIRYYFLKSYLMEGTISKSNLQDCFRSELFLIQKGKSATQYLARRRQFFKLDTKDKRKDLTNERVIGLLHDTRIIFDQFANIKNGGL